MALVTFTAGEKLTAAKLNSVAQQAFDALEAGADLSDVTDPAAARAALELGTMATQAASAVAITGGTVAAALAASTVLATGTSSSRTLGLRFADVKNVADFGAIGDDSTDDTAAINAALAAVPSAGGVVVIPPHFVCRVSAPLVAKAKTRITGGGTIKAKSSGSWAGGSPYHGIKNTNSAASSITDSDIVIDGITIDWSALGAVDGTEHVIWIRKARRVRVLDCTITGGASSVALLGCDDTLVDGNSLLNFYNCGSDHWDGPGNARVSNNHIQTTASAQMANFNPEPTGLSSGYTAANFVFEGNTCVSTEDPATPCQFEPLASGNAVRNIVVKGNIFKNVRVACRGDSDGIVFEGNLMSDFQGDDEVFTAYTWNGGSPAGLSIRGNVIRDPLTSLANVGVIRAQTDSAVIDGNIILGAAYAAAAITGNANTPVVPGTNYVERDAANAAQKIGHIRSGFAVRNGTANYIGFTTTGGYRPHLRVQGDNNFVLVGVDSGGNDRPLLACQQESDTAALRTGADVNFEVQELQLHTPITVAATGTTIGGAADVPATCTRVTSCTAGVADGVRLRSVAGATFEVINETSDLLKVYPNNSGSAEIDAGGASVPVTVAAGKAKSFRCTASGVFRTTAAT